jgi:hypothetical protein
MMVSSYVVVYVNETLLSEHSSFVSESEDYNMNAFSYIILGRRVLLCTLSFNKNNPLTDTKRTNGCLLIQEATVSCLLFCHMEYCLNNT